MKLTLVKNNPRYWEFVRNLRNMSGIREEFIEQQEISAIQQAQYMLKYNSNFWICLDGDKPAGYVGIIEDDIRVATHPNFQGQGVGSFMINEIMKVYPTATAKIKMDNMASIKLFEKCGFVKKYYLLEKEENAT